MPGFARICVYGVGAIGSYLAAKLALTGCAVTGIARGKQFDAIRARGITLIEQGGRQTVRINAVATPAAAGPQDLVILAMKSHAIPAVAGDVAPLFHADTGVVTATNGLPWWYFHRSGLPEPGSLASVDPDARLWHGIGARRAIGCVVYPAARLIEPGVVEHLSATRFTVGEPGGGGSPRVAALAALLQAAGFDGTAPADIRPELWTKLAANVAYNPVSILTGGTIGALIDDPDVAVVLTGLIEDTIAVAKALTVSVPVTPAQLMTRSRGVADHKTSMLQDLEARRPVELDPIVGAVQEIGRRFGVRTPTVDRVYALARQRARLAGCYP